MADDDRKTLAKKEMQFAEQAAHEARKAAIAEKEAADALKGDERVGLPKNYSLL